MPKKNRIFARKSPKQGRSKSLVTTILTATTRVLESGGYAKATTNRVAELAGVSIGSLYQYFPSKEALVAAILDQQIERNQKRFETKIRDADGKSFDELLEIVIQTAADVYLGNRKIMTILFEQTPALEKTQHVLRARAHVSQLLGVAIERYKGDLKPQNLELAIYVSVNAVLGVLSAALLSYPANAKDADLTREMTAMVRRYFTA